jgi:hypothetical protein
MFLAGRIQAALLGVVALIAARPAVAAEPLPTNAQCIAASESGQDLRHASKLRAARVQFAVCVATSCPGPIREDCAQQLEEVVKMTPSVVFELKDSAGNDVAGVVATVDGEGLAAADNAAGTAVELDPGEHTFSFEGAGFKKNEMRLVMVGGAKQRRELVVMNRRESMQTATTMPPAATHEASPRSGRPPTLSWVAFGVGGAGLMLGVTAGLVAGSKHASLSDVCDNAAGTCRPDYADDLSAFHTWRTVSTVGYVIGAVGIAGGATIWLTAPRAGNATARLWLGPASAGIVGRF